MQDDWKLLPAPAWAQPATGALSLGAGLKLVSAGPSASPVGRLAQRFQQRFDRLLGRAPTAAAATLEIRVENRGPRPLPSLQMDETSRLTVTPQGATINAAQYWGAAQGLERCLQLVRFAADGPEFPAGKLEDGPRLPWRGLLLDLARHFLGLPALLRTLDAMAAAGLNVLHLHLNDDQGFGLECPRRPALHGKAAPQGYLSVAAAGQLVQAAAERGIRVVPELDVPGHAGAILTAYPELAAAGAPRSLPRAFGQTPGALDPTLAATWDFLDDLLADLTAVFPDAYLHMGGDEVHPDAYSFADKPRREWMTQRGLRDGAAVQSWFMAELGSRIQALGRRPVAWDEVLHPDLPRDVVIQSWRGAASLQAASAAGHDVIFSAGYYLDLNYPAGWHHEFAPDLGADALTHAERRLRERPELAPVVSGLAALHEAAGRARPSLPSGQSPGCILGGEACLWGELVTAEVLDRRLHSRLAAVAERLWSPLQTCDLNDFERRLPGWLQYLEAVTDCRPLQLPAVALRRWQVLPEERAALIELLDALAPVRWYRRLLGDEVLAARLAGAALPPAARQRPYDADSPLIRPVDQVCPDSLSTLQLQADLQSLLARDAAVDGPDQPAAQALAAAALNRLQLQAQQWRSLPGRLRPAFRRSSLLAELQPQVDRLAALGSWLQDWLTQAPSGAVLNRPLGVRLRALTEAARPPVADTELAVLAPLRALLDTSRP